MLVVENQRVTNMQECLLRINDKDDYVALDKELYNLRENGEISLYNYNISRKRLNGFFQYNKKKFCQNGKEKKNKQEKIEVGFDQEILERQEDIRKLYIEKYPPYMIKQILDEQFSINLSFTQINKYIELISKGDKKKWAKAK